MADAGDDIAQYLLSNKEKAWRFILWSYRKVKDSGPEDFVVERYDSVENAAIRSEALEQVLGEESYVIGSDLAGWSVYVNTKTHQQLSQPDIAHKLQVKMDELNNDKDLIPVLVSK